MIDRIQIDLIQLVLHAIGTVGFVTLCEIYTQRKGDSHWKWLGLKLVYAVIYAFIIHTLYRAMDMTFMILT